jgi:hypothetical protein
VLNAEIDLKYGKILQNKGVDKVGIDEELSKIKPLVLSGGASARIVDRRGNMRISFIFAMKSYADRTLEAGIIQQEDVESWLKNRIKEITGDENTEFGKLNSFNTEAVHPELSVSKIVLDMDKFDIEMVHDCTDVFNEMPLFKVIKYLMDVKNPEETLMLPDKKNKP